MGAMMRVTGKAVLRGFLVLASGGLFACVPEEARIVESGAWIYESRPGLEGIAYTQNDAGQRFEVECGNGGGPAFGLFPDPVQSEAPPELAGPLLMQLAVDEALFDQSFECFGGEHGCLSSAMPPVFYVEKMRQGKRLQVIYRGDVAARFSLDGADEAIGNLKACLSP
jgi:hypothetical protein